MSDTGTLGNAAPGVHSVRATRALRKLSEEDPAFAALALWCEHRDGDTGAARARSAGTRITYGTGFGDLSLPEQVGLCAHHILHVALRHGARGSALKARLGDAYDDGLFNLGADAIANTTVEAAGYALPRPSVLLPDLVGRALSAPADAEQALRDWDAEKLYIALTRQDRGAGMGDAPSRTRAPSDAGTSAERAGGYGKEQGFEEDLDPDGGGDEAEEAREDANWQARLAKALEAGRQAGRGLGTVGHRLGDIPRSRTPWERHLRRLVSRAVMPAPRRSYQRPAGRWLALDAAARASGGPEPVFEPGQRRDLRVPRLAVALDMSGSIPDALLAKFAGEIDGIVRRSGAETHLILFDDAVRNSCKLSPGTLRATLHKTPMARDGGTNLAPPLAAAAALRPSLTILLTDLDGPTGPCPRGLDVLWAIPAEAPPRRPGFGRVISLAR
ncbi:MAG: VWA-like domain-containing protein [Pseudomonadota bacterium]